MKERYVTKRIMTYLRGHGVAIRMAVYGTYQEAGWPDILFFRRRAAGGTQAFGFEVKVGKRKATPLQEHRMRALEDAGFVCAVVGSLEEVKEVLQSAQDGV